MMWMGLIAAMGCMKLHAVQVGEIESSAVLNGERFEIKLSAIGFSTKELGEIAGMAASSQKGRETSESISSLIELFQQGPRTGEPVVDPRFADRLHRKILDRCPSGDVSGLMTIRETADYPGLTGEIVKVVGYCGGNQ